MKPRLNVITLAVRDLEKSLAFYRDGLGLPTNGIIGTEYKGNDVQPSGAIALFELRGGLLLALYPRSELSKDAKMPDTAPSALEFSLGYAVVSQEAVDELLQRAKAAGGTVTDKPHNRPWGIYSGYFLDLDGHLWEILWNPQIQIKD
ncbi:MAG TPA: VOC family protein [bacterium]|nr:VOC family protein [bacterium]